MRRAPAVLALLGTVLLLPGVVAADAGTARGAALANACAACHGPQGRSQGAIPSIDALSAEDFVVAMKAFRTDTRQGTVMNRIAKGLNEADIAAVATYFVIMRQR